MSRHAPRNIRALVLLLPALLFALLWLVAQSNRDQTKHLRTDAATIAINPARQKPAAAIPPADIDLRMRVAARLRDDARAHAAAGQPLPPDFLERAVRGNAIRLPLPDGKAAEGPIEGIERDDDGVLAVYGRILLPRPGRFLIQRQTAPGVAGPFVGHVLYDEGDKGWMIEPIGNPALARFVPRHVDAIVCRSLAMPPDDGGDNAGDPMHAPQTHPTNIPIPHYQPVIPLQSLPGATGVIYLDFDGENGPFPGWGPVHFDAAPANATNSQIFDVWRRVSEDFQGFNLNITTDRKVFDDAPPGRRQQVIITPTNLAAPGAGGVAYINSFNWTTARPCWAFIQTGKNAAEVVSHEIGHTLGLQHHGRTSPVEEYYGGHGGGDVGWAPIMGTGYSRNLTQWSKGEYLNANRASQNDLLVIATTNNDVAYRDDDHGHTPATASHLEILPNNSVANEGVIERTGDIDAFRFQTTGGSINLAVNPVSAGPNLDIHAEIVDVPTLTPVIANNPANALNATLSTHLPAGDYLLRVRGTGRGDPLGDGYTDYGSLGAYLISGTIQGGVKPERFSIAENSPAGTPVGTVPPRNNHGGAPIAFTFASGNTGGAFAIDATTGTLTVANPSALDFEALSSRWDDPAVITPLVAITNTANPSLNESIRVVVQILDVNEPPVITATSFTMLERTHPGTLLATAKATDPDRFQLLSFSLTSGNGDGWFHIDPHSGEITVAQPIDVTHTLTHQLGVTATDTGSPPLSTTATIDVTIIDHAWPVMPGRITRTIYENISGSTVASLTSHPRFPGAPDLEVLLDAFDGGEHGDNYGSTIRGHFIAPATGAYRFRLASDDHGELLFASNGNPASATRIASVSGWTNPYQWNKYSSQASQIIQLVEGQVCYIEARHKESGGGDHVAVGWTGPLNAAIRVLPGMFLAPVYQNFPPRIPAAAYQIRENAIPGQSLGFVRPLDANLDESFSGFEIIGGSGAEWFDIDATSGRITVAKAPDIALSPLSLAIRVADGGSPQLTGEGTVTITITPADEIGTDAIVQQIWSGINGTTLANLANHPAYPYAPSSIRLLADGFDSGTNLGDNYGSRVRALVTPPTTGDYRFYLTTDDNGLLRMSTNDTPSRASDIAEVPGWAGPNDWTKFASQTSAPRRLVGGQSYFIEALQKEGGGGDHLRVAWTGPGISSITLIPAAALRPFDINAPPVFTPASHSFTLDATAAPGTTVGTLTAADPEGEPLAFDITSGNETGNFVIDSSGNLTFASASGLANGLATLTVTAQDAGINGLYPLKSATATVNIQVTHADDYPTWASQWAHPGIGGPQDDFNGDGMSNNEKRIWGLDPTDASLRQPIILPSLHPTDDLAFSYTRRNPALTGMSFSVWVSTDMVEWREDTAAVQTASAPDANQVETVSVTLAASQATQRLFVRIQADSE